MSNTTMINYIFVICLFTCIYISAMNKEQIKLQNTGWETTSLVKSKKARLMEQHQRSLALITELKNANEQKHPEIFQQKELYVQKLESKKQLVIKQDGPTITFTYDEKIITEIIKTETYKQCLKDYHYLLKSPAQFIL